jgi:hypothetical protein
MDRKRVVTLTAFAIIMAAGFLVYFLIYVKEPPIQGQLINGRDEHGCIVGSFYWNETISACINDSFGKIAYQVYDFQTCYDAGYPVNEDLVTGLLQCYASNGTVFTQQNSTSELANNTSGMVYPSNIAIVGNFTITQNSTNGTNVTAPNPYQSANNSVNNS